MKYIVVSTSHCNYQDWQIKLLYWSLKRVRQEGKLVILLSDDNGHPGEYLDYNWEDVITITQPDYAQEYQTANNDWWGGIPNKYKSIEWLVDNNYFQDDDDLLFLDPDMVFTKPINISCNPEEIKAQRWIDYIDCESIPASGQHGEGIMYPFILKFSTLKTITPLYVKYCQTLRPETNNWISEMWALDGAVKDNGIKIEYLDQLGTCLAWNSPPRDKEYNGDLLHFPNEVIGEEDKRLFFKQDYTFDPNMPFDLSKPLNRVDQTLITNVDQSRTDYIYHQKWNDEDLFKFYDGSAGYLAFQPWPGGFNNIRMSLELAVCHAYLNNRTLVLPPSYPMYLLEGESSFASFFDENLGIKSIKIEDFAPTLAIEPTLDRLKEVSKVIEYDSQHVVNYTQIPLTSKFTKNKGVELSENHFTDDSILFMEGECLLGNFEQTIYTHEDKELKRLIAKHVHYRDDLMNLAWQFVNQLGDQTYYAIHIRRNDFQYKDLFITCEEILANIQDRIPEGARLYISTDHKDKDFFQPLRDKYTLFFYEDILEQVKTFDEFDVNWIPIIEQLICTRSIRFISNSHSTLSSYVFRLRGYMNDIEDKTYHVNTIPYKEEEQVDYIDVPHVIGNWHREFKSTWDFKPKSIFVSIASYRDSEIINTLKSLYEEVADISRVTVGVNLQDDKEAYGRLLAEDFPNLKVIFTPHEEANGVVLARNLIKDRLYNGEDYFLQIDSHSRFKKRWDNILITQYEALPEGKNILTTYPNHYDVPSPNKEYLDLPFNTPLYVKDFASNDIRENRSKASNKASLEPYQIEPTRWCAAGFLFTTGQWLTEIKIPSSITFLGEEDFQTHLSYLKGWNLFITSEATIWHNYNFKTTEEEPYRTHNPLLNKPDMGADLVNRFLFEEKHQRTIEELEDYFEITLKKPETYVSTSPIISTPKDKTIFVSIASFIDKELRYTILDCINKAENPQNLHFGVCLQFNNEEGSNERCIDDLIEKYNISVRKFFYTESEGGCWARNQVQQLYKNEKYSLQVDAHFRFRKNWDTLAIEQYEELKRHTPKPIISFLGLSYSRNEELGIDYNFTHIDQLDLVHKPIIREITVDYWPDFHGPSNFIHTNGMNIEVPILYCGFVFTSGEWTQEVQNDPEHYYTGEEFALSIRSYTHGYNIFLPKELLAWHREHPNGRLNHYNTFDNNDEKHTHAMTRLKKLIFNEDLGRYGLGTERSLEEYEQFAKIDIKNRNVHN